MMVRIMGRKNAPEAPKVPVDLWRELYEAARQFQIMAPWNWMDDVAVLGVINQLGMRLLCVLGDGPGDRSESF